MSIQPTTLLKSNFPVKTTDATASKAPVPFVRSARTNGVVHADLKDATPMNSAKAEVLRACEALDMKQGESRPINIGGTGMILSRTPGGDAYVLQTLHEAIWARSSGLQLDRALQLSYNAEPLLAETETNAGGFKLFRQLGEAMGVRTGGHGR